MSKQIALSVTVLECILYTDQFSHFFIFFFLFLLLLLKPEIYLAFYYSYLQFLLLFDKHKIVIERVLTKLE